MKNLMIILLLGLTLVSFGQPKKFKNLNDYTIWIMNYYKNPEPQRLFESFKFGTHSKEIANGGNRSIMMGFFSSCLRKDTTLQLEFYEKLKDTKEEDFIYGFGLTLWYIHTDFSLKLMSEFQNHDNIKKYNTDFEKLKKEKFTNIWTDSIKTAEHLDMLWADFFATGNENSVKRVISKLTDLKSTDYFDMVTANSAKWSLTSNSITHDKVMAVCKEEMSNKYKRISDPINQIVQEAEKQRKKKN